jgi:hypothetical protein
MNQILETQEQELFTKLEKLYWQRERYEIGTPEYSDIDSDLQMANDDLDQVRKQMCEDHMSRIYSQGGYDRCAECGSRF